MKAFLILPFFLFSFFVSISQKVSIEDAKKMLQGEWILSEDSTDPNYIEDFINGDTLVRHNKNQGNTQRFFITLSYDCGNHEYLCMCFSEPDSNGNSFHCYLIPKISYASYDFFKGDLTDRFTRKKKP